MPWNSNCGGCGADPSLADRPVASSTDAGLEDGRNLWRVHGNGHDAGGVRRNGQYPHGPAANSGRTNRLLKLLEETPHDLVSSVEDVARSSFRR